MHRAEAAKRYKIDLAQAATPWDAACGPHVGPGAFSFEPQTIVDRYDGAHPKKLVRDAVRDWVAFEGLHLEWDHLDFARIMNLGSVDPSVEVFLITDEGLIDRGAFRFLRSDFEDFVAWYESEYAMEFFQPADYIMFDRTIDYLSVLHHGGAIFGASPRALL